MADAISDVLAQYNDVPARRDWRSNMDVVGGIPTGGHRAPDILRGGPTPSGRDRLFDAIYGGLGGTPDRRSVADALTNLFDVGTFGMATGAYDGAQELAQTGRPASLAMAIMPGARVAAPVAKAAGKAATGAVQGIRGYHGSPHDFNAERLVRYADGRTEYVVGTPDRLPDVPTGAYAIKDFPLGRFREDKVGTGEGAQAYGHGVAYIAENENVAKSYRDTLGNYSDTVKWKGAEPPNDVQRSLLRQLGGADASGRMMTVDSLAKELRQTKRGLVDWDDAGNAVAPKSGHRAAEYARIEQQLAELQRMAPLVETTPPGRMYEVNIKANPEQFIDFDKQHNEQSAFVNAALAKARAEGRFPEAPRRYIPRTPKETDALREAGIAGVRYLDQGSRVAGEGSRNYVVFDDALVDIVRKYGIAGLLAAYYGGASDAEAAPFASTAP